MHLKPARLITLFSLFLFKALTGYCQNTNPGTNGGSQPLNTYLTNFVQPAPNAASLGKYADYPVGYYTGVPEISIPIYTLKDDGISLPISLSYHASGIHVSELASWVGLGWALNATGVINRTVRGGPDEGSLKVGPGIYGPGGYYRDHGLSTLMNIPYPIPGTQQNSDPGRLFYLTVTPDIMSGGADCESDLYTFNFNGHTGKFVFDEKGVPRLLEDDNLKIVPVFNTSTNTFTSFVITTADGIQYFFGENNAHEVTRPHSGGNVEDIDDVAPTSWYLTRIYNPNTKETANFNYANEGYSYYDLGPESQYYGGDNTNFVVGDVCDNHYINQGNQVSNFLNTTIQGLKLTSIVTNNYTVQFIAKNVRTDVSSTVYQSWKNAATSYDQSGHYSPPCMLDSIKIYTNLNNTCIKQFALGHTYFTSTTTTAPAVLSSVALYGNDNSDTRRLQLASVTEISGDGTIQKPPYVLTYNNTPLPRRLSYDQDHWGFSNDSLGNNNNIFTPTITYYACTINNQGANRHPRWPDMSGFTLTGIQDPLGVNTSFVFGPNSANNTGFYVSVYNESADTLVGGLRIQQIRVTDNVTGNTKIRSFAYNTPNSTQPGGEVTKNPIYLLTPVNEYWQNLALGSSTEGYQGYCGEGFTSPDGHELLRQSQSIVPLQDANGNHIVYPYVREIFGQKGQGGYTQYTYTTFSQSSSNSSLNSRLDFSNYGTYGSMYLPTIELLASGYFGNGEFNDTIAFPHMLPVQLQYSTNYEMQNLSYPFAPQQVDVVSGKIKEQDTYDSSNNLLVSVTNNYSTTYHENFWLRGLKAYSENFGATFIPANGVVETNYPGAYPALTFYKLHTGVSHLVSTTKKVYSGANFVAQTTTYGYESPYHTLKTSDTTTDSQGDTLVSKTYYSWDYANSATTDNIFGKMKAKRLLEPVDVQNWRNGNLVGERVTKFYDFAASAPDTLINPIYVYNLETASVLTPAQAGESMTWSAPVSTLLQNSYLKNKVNFNYDDVTGKLTTQQLTLDKYQGVQWATQLQKPEALVDNAQNTPLLKEFYFEGFENDNPPGLYSGIGHTGTHCAFAPYTVDWTVPNSRSYVITYWYLAGGVWTLQPEQPFTGHLALSGGTAYDDIRIYPTDVLMVTYTYDADGNVTSTTDAKNLTTYYEYDSFQRLKNIRDYKNNIVKSYCYNYAGQANGCFITQPVYNSAAQSKIFTRICAGDSTGSPVNYQLATGAYSSNISTQDATNKAIADVNANGQNYANLNGGCTINTTFLANNGTSETYVLSMTAGTLNISTVLQPHSGPVTINNIPIGPYSISVYPQTNTNYQTDSFTFSLTGQTTYTSVPRADYSTVQLTTGTQLSLTIQ